MKKIHISVCFKIQGFHSSNQLALGRRVDGVLCAVSKLSNIYLIASSWAAATFAISMCIGGNGFHCFEQLMENSNTPKGQAEETHQEKSVSLFS